MTSKKPKTAAMRLLPFTKSIVLSVPIDTSSILAKKIKNACINMVIYSSCFRKNMFHCIYFYLICDFPS
ncbi:hypothetical protein SDC9_169143 [bioreactor metagenome]|uniref:Uncharacterized protein n=1 Tax=bioreactor metagenome TaxID=1076179 RepID=A0A645GD51_9ZZZZ